MSVLLDFPILQVESKLVVINLQYLKISKYFQPRTSVEEQKECGRLKGLLSRGELAVCKLHI